LSTTARSCEPAIRNAAQFERIPREPQGFRRDRAVEEGSSQDRRLRPLCARGCPRGSEAEWEYAAAAGLFPDSRSSAALSGLRARTGAWLSDACWGLRGHVGGAPRVWGALESSPGAGLVARPRAGQREHSRRQRDPARRRESGESKLERRSRRDRCRGVEGEQRRHRDRRQRVRPLRRGLVPLRVLCLGWVVPKRLE
jgi:hypothetical protein